MMLTKQRQESAFKTLSDSFGYKGPMAAPRIQKVVVSVGTGSNKDKNRGALVADRLAKITGQHAAPRSAKKSIAAFKSREGDVVGYQVTLRGARMYDFLEKLIHIALPRTRDFRGLAPTAIDEMGNLTIGIKEHSIFPETSDEDLKDVFGLAVTTVTSAKGKKEAEAFFRHLGFPLKSGDAKAR
jgi:large subunit ribosomal protein L5